MFLVGFHEKIQGARKKCPRAPGSTQNNSRKNVSQIELEGRAWKCLGPITKSIVDGTVLYCTVQLYCTSTMPWSSQFYNIERFLMTGMEARNWSSAAAQRLHGTHLTPETYYHQKRYYSWYTPETYYHQKWYYSSYPPRHIITRSDITHRIHRDILSPEVILLIEVDLVRLRMMWAAPTSTSSSSSRVGPGAVWETASTSRAVWWTAAASTSRTVWTVQNMSENPIVTCARILRTGEKLIL